jgi:hypothetical protein
MEFFIRIIYPEYIDYIPLRIRTKPYRLLSIYRNISKYNRESKFNINILTVVKNISRIRYMNLLRIWANKSRSLYYIINIRTELQNKQFDLL